VKLSFSVNGAPRAVDVPPLKRLLDLLREDLQLTGTKEGCGEGECGACSVLIDGELVNSCLVAASQVEGARVTTIEGIGAKDRLEPLQRCFIDHGGAQCGICTPGMIVAAQRFLDSGKEPTDGNIREAIAGNLCRCTGYQKIVDAIADAARAPKSEGAR
jgi:aerobic carbon-monoxide dehydrogenase small subunit